MDRSTSDQRPLTRLGRAVRAVGGGTARGGGPGGGGAGRGGTGAGGAGRGGPGGGGVDQAQHREQHRQANWLRDVILGGQDGLVNILGIILGVIAGGGGKVVLLAAGFAAAITESISMGAVGYTSTMADRDYFAAQRAVEQESVVDDPELERREITELYRSKGFSGTLL